MAEARRNFSALVDEAVATHQWVLVTRNGVPAVWMISDEDFESIMETLDVLADAGHDAGRRAVESELRGRPLCHGRRDGQDHARPGAGGRYRRRRGRGGRHARPRPAGPGLHGDAGCPHRGTREAGPVSYRIVLRPAAVRALQRMPEKISAVCWEFIHSPLAESPRRVGKPLLEPLAPQYSARRGEYRVLYLIENEQVTIIITSPAHRADTYRTR